MSGVLHATGEPALSLVIPYFNDYDRVVQRLPEVRAFLDDRAISHEVILVDDGSRIDRTSDLRCRFPWLEVLRNDTNRGKGYSVRRGMLAARGRHRFFTDADVPFGMEPIEVGMRALEQGCDLVIGDRGAPESVYYVDQTATRRLASRAFTILVSRVIVPGVRDTQCGLKGFRAETAEFIFRRLRLDRFAFDVEIVYLALLHHLSLRRLPVVLEHAEESTLRLHWDSLVMLYEVAQIKWNDARGHYR